MPLHKFVSQILIAFGILLINLFLFTVLASLVCKSVFCVNVAQILTNSNFKTISSNQLNAIRIFQGIVSLGSFTFSAFIISLFFKKKPLEYLKLNKTPDLKILLFIPVIFFASVPFISWLIELNAGFKFPEFLSNAESYFKEMEMKNNNIYDLMLIMNSPAELFSNLIFMALIPAIGEELFCRGVLLNIFYGYTQNFYRSVLIVAFIFSIFHLQFYKIVPMVTIAFILGIFVNWTQGLWASIIFHFLNNSMAISGKYLFERGYDNFFTNQGTVFPFYFVILSFVVTFAILYYLNKGYKNG